MRTAGMKKLLNEIDGIQLKTQLHTRLDTTQYKVLVLILE